jgi:alkylhydroperoxidase/carboxymuconolactone decarboxylase family protein
VRSVPFREACGIRKEQVGHILDFFRELTLVSAADSRSILWLFEAACPFHAQLSSADSIHIHVKVDDTADLPHAAIRNAGGQPQSEQNGYIKYAFPEGLNAIFSSIPVAEDDRLSGLPSPKKPFLDHAGMDMRRETSAVRRQFEAIPEIAGRTGWRHVPQGGAGRAVYCCHTQVNEKHWVYPPATLAAFARPLEFAFGPLVVHAASMGCDLRPIDPSHPRASEAGCCSTASHKVNSPDPAPAASYYEPKDLSRFAEVGRYASATMEKFWAYFSTAVSQPGALSVREKALIALAVAHSKQCPYCIDSLTAKCLEAGSNPEQMHEALHVAAAMAAGIDLVHGVQMQNALRAKGAIE